MKEDIVIGHITNYTFNQIKPWITSLDKCGFTGKKLMVCYNIDYETINELQSRDINVAIFDKDDNIKKATYPKKDFNIVVDRFYWMWKFLRSMQDSFRYVITTDVKDVIFQRNPSEWLENNLGDKHINVSTESLKYKNEEWGYNNIFNSFGSVLCDYMMENLIYNCGVLAGDIEYMLDLFLNIHLLCDNMNHHISGGGGPDQAALNILLNMSIYRDITKFNMSEEAWAAQLGTTGPQVKHKFGDKLEEKSPQLLGNLVCTSEGVPFVIVHQYDRVNEWKDIILKRLGV